MKKAIWKILAGMLLLGGLASCSQPMQADSPSNTPWKPAETESPETPTPSNADARETAQESEVARTSAYRAALEGLYFDHIGPDGFEIYFDDDCDMTDNRFAIYDVDLDGRDELILEYTSTIAAGKVAWIYDFDSETHLIREQFRAYPKLTFFDNGVVEEGLSHNQGHGGRFWPYTLYQYDPETDTYSLAGQADAWDMVKFPEGFPEGVDPDADGFIYYLNLEYDTPVDGETYMQWRNLYVGGAQAVDISYVNLTVENIAALKCVGDKN